MNFDLPLEKTALVDKSPSQGGLGLTDPKVIAAGAPCRSALFYRMAKLGKGHMPYLGSTCIDERGLDLIYDWIQQLPAGEENLVASNSPAKLQPKEKAALRQLGSSNNLTARQQSEAIEQMLSSVSDALALVRALDQKSLRPAICQTVIAKGSAASEPLVRDLFERFLPDEKRVRVLGSNIKPEAVLAIKGDAGRGRRFFRQEGGAQCQTCHRAEGVGRDFGPDLSRVGQKYTRAQILENILQPSKSIDPKYIAYMIETRDEAAHTGFLVSKSANEVVLKEANANEIRLSTANIQHMEALRLSLMPEGLLQGMSAQEAADLIEYLHSLR
jgi:putative heme-binding domain-containing protein